MFSKKYNKIKLKYLAVFIFLVIISFLFTNKTNAASLSFSPNQTTVSVGNIISLKVITNTDNKSINNAEASIQFPVDILEVVSITKNSSIFTLWVEEPSFSNITGKINFNGGLPTPGYTGQGGQIATITFKAKKIGTASIIFTDAAIRENDGLGTNILTSKNSAIIQIGNVKEIEIPTTPSDKNVAPAKPVIVSDTHPDQDFWYKNDTANFSWKIPGGVTSIKTLFSKDPIATPTISYDNSVTRKTLNNLSDGISYFHLRFFSAIGASPIAHYKIKIDSTPPLLFTPTIRREEGQNLIKLNAEDVISGIDYYTIQIDTDSPLKISKNDLINNDEYVLPVQKEGSHSLIILAYDKAGNYTESKATFESLPITSPVLSLSSKEITTGESVTIFGKTDYPGKQVNIVVENDNKEIGRYIQTTKTDGTFEVTTDKITTVGTINVWAETVFSDVIKSTPSSKVYLKVNETAVVRVALSIVFPLLYIIIILILILIILIILYLGWHRYFGLKKKIEIESKETTIEVHRAMILLKEELNNQLMMLERVKTDRSLNEKEEEVFNEIKNNVDEIDEFVEKKLKKLM